MRLFGWFRRPPARPDIPKYTHRAIETAEPKPRQDVVTPYIHRPEPGIVVEEVDTRDMTATGVHRAWRGLAGDR